MKNLASLLALMALLSHRKAQRIATKDFYAGHYLAEQLGQPLRIHRHHTVDSIERKHHNLNQHPLISRVG